MKVLILANSSSGLYQFRRELILDLIKKGIEVVASLPEQDMTAEIEADGCRTVQTRINRRGMNPIQDMSLLQSYRKLLELEKPDVVLTYTIKPNVYGGIACQMAGIPYLANITGLGSALENGGMVQKIALALYRLGLRKATRVFLQNTYNQDFYNKHKMGSKEKGYLIPGSGVSLEHFAVLPFSETPGFLFISRVMKEKGIDQYLAVAKQVHKEHPEVEFTVLGACEESYQQELEELVTEGVIQYPGKVKDIIPYMRKAQCLIHPSYYSEGMSNVCLEAAACGRAVITTDHPGCRETVTDGISGYLVEKASTASLLKAVKAFLNLTPEERRLMGMAGRQKVEAEFDRKIVINAYEQAMEDVAGV